MIKTVMPLSSIIAMRFLGLFLVLPVISVYAMELKGATTFLVGIVIGGYALTQMIFQVPFGIMSDKLGRKGTIITGLLLFAIGSIICALSTDIFSLMLGRFLQGAGAIGAVISAMISDLVREEQRAKAMALMGGSIAVSFAVAMIGGPTLGAWFGVESLFWITTLLALGSIIILIKTVPDAPEVTHSYQESSKIKDALYDMNLMKMNITNFLQKGLMTFAFMLIPLILVKNFGWQMNELWKVYLPAMVFGVAAMGPASILAEKKGKFKEVLMIGIVLFALSYLMLGNVTGTTLFIAGVVIFFIGFNMHEPIMQSLASKFAKVHQRGTVLGIFNSFGYFGTFIGGLAGGIYYDKIPLSSIATIITIICLAWITLIATMPNPSKKKMLYLKLSECDKDKFKEINEFNGVDEWYINETEQILIVKYDESEIEEEVLKGSLK